MYGQGIWAPCIRYHDGRFHIFAKINERGLQVFTAAGPAEPQGGTVLVWSPAD